MLVLSRKCGEAIVLPELGVTVTLIAIEGGRIRLGFDGPREISVVRQKPQPEPSSNAVPFAAPTSPEFATAH